MTQAPARFPLAPPVLKVPVIDLRTGSFNAVGLNWAQQIWAGIQGSGGVAEQIAIIFGMHGDGSLSAEGVLTVTGSDGHPFVASAFVDTTNASNITTGALASTLLFLGGGLTIVGGAVTADLGTGLEFAGTAIAVSGTIPRTVATLPAAAAGARGFVTDSTLAATGNFGAAVVGGGASAVPVWSDGTGWFIG